MSARALLVAGARPNFVKIAPLHRALVAEGSLEPVVLHTGQHYDREMSQVFFDELGIPAPDVDLGVGSGTHARQTAAIMAAFEPELERLAPAVVVVVGDVNSTLACALVAQRAGHPLAHVEAGLRSGDRSMPEEINRVLTDQLCDWLYTPTEAAGGNLLREGVSQERIVFAGNIMIDALLSHLEKAAALNVAHGLGLKPRAYALVTLHRPATVDDAGTFDAVLAELDRLAERIPVVFPVHPRAKARLEARSAGRRIRLLDPLGYLSFLSLMRDARLVVTDSGGVQEETTFLGVPCVTVRTTTERPITVERGTNRLSGLDPGRVRAAIDSAIAEDAGERAVLPRWDGRTAERIARHLAGEVPS